jgi:predicted DNA-binding transcriptional regulator AlpA
MKRRPTLDEVREWPATVSVELGAAAFGCSRAHAYESIRTGTFPARTLRVGNRIVVVTSSILSALDGDRAVA